MEWLATGKDCLESGDRKADKQIIRYVGVKRKKKSKQRPVPDTSAQNPFTKNLIEVAGHATASLNNQESRKADHATFQIFNLLFNLIDLIKNKERKHNIFF